jgi:starvation-inducible DNA-binding protein
MWAACIATIQLPGDRPGADWLGIHGGPATGTSTALPDRRRQHQERVTTMTTETKNAHFDGPLYRASGLSSCTVRDIPSTLNTLLADLLALYIKTKNFHWHVSGSHFRDYHLLLDEQSAQLLAVTDAIAERVRKIGGTTIRSIGHVARLQRVVDNDAEQVEAVAMVVELREDNQQLAARMRAAHVLCDECGDVATAGLLEVWIDEAEQRTWFLSEVSR